MVARSQHVQQRPPLRLACFVDCAACHHRDSGSSNGIYVLIFQYSIILLQAAIILLEAFCVEPRRPTRSILYKILGPVLTIITLLLILLLWLASGVLLAVTTVGADFCIDPNNNVLNVSHETKSSVAVYFVCIYQMMSICT